MRTRVARLEPTSNEEKLRGLRGLARLADTVGRTRDLDALYSEALDALTESLAVERSSILLFDDNGVMRFRAWRGISESYRQQVDGHSPWRPGSRQPLPLLVEDVETAGDVRDFRSTFRAEGIAALAFVPLVFDGRLLGKFMLYYDEPHRFDDEEVLLASTIASHVAFAVAQRVAEDRLEATHAHLEMTLRAQERARKDAERTASRIASLQRVTSALSEAATVQQVAQVIATRCVDALGAMSGAVSRIDERRQVLDLLCDERASLFGTARYGHVPLDGRAPSAEAARTRMAVFVESFEEMRDRYPAVADAAERVESLACVPLMSAAGIYGVLTLRFPRATSFDADQRLFLCALADQGSLALERARLLEEERDAHRRAEADHRRASFLANASAVLSATLEVEEALRAVATMAVPFVADWCVMRVVDEPAEEPRVIFACGDPAHAPIVEQLTQRRAPAQGAGSAAGRALAKGEAVLIEHVTEEVIRDHVEDPALAASLRRLGACSAMSTPLQVRGRIVGALCFVACEPAGRFGEDDLAMAQSLAHRVALAVDNASLLEAAQQATRSREELLAVVSHDLRTPLAAIALSAGVLARNADAADERQRRHVGVIQRNATRMDHLIRDLLDFSRLDAGQLILEAASLPVRELLDDAMDTWRPLCGGRELTIETSIDRELMVTADAEAVSRVLGNLIGNAIRHIPQHGRISLGADVRDTDVLIRVIDDGPGIAADDLSHLFKRWYRAPEGRKARGGAGLGLFIASSLVEALGGTIYVESELGRGASFFFTLPLVDAAGTSTATDVAVTTS